MDITKHVANLDKVPEGVRKHTETKSTETDKYRYTEIIRFKKLRKNINFRLFITDWKRLLYIGLIILTAFIVAAGIRYWLHNGPKTSISETPAKPEGMARWLKIGIYGHLKTAVFSEREMAVEQGDIIVFYPTAEPVRKISRGGIEMISIKELMNFTIPGHAEKFWLGDEVKPTVIQCETKGYLRFNLDYPDTSARFVTYEKRGEIFREAPLKIRIEWIKKLPLDYADPRQIARPKGIVGAFFPDLKVEVEGALLDLRAESRKAWRGQEPIAKSRQWVTENTEKLGKYLK